MEAFLLNPSATPQNTASQQNISTMDSDEVSGFAPAMEEAATSLENSNNQDSGSSNTDNGEQNGTAFTEGTSSIESVIPQTPFSPDTITEISDDTAISSAEIVLSIQGSIAPVSEGNIAPIPEESIAPVAAKSDTLQAPLSSQTQQDAFKSIVTKDGLPAPIANHEVPAPVIPTNVENTAPPVTKAETLLLQQIQQILDQGKNDGPVSITANNNSANNSLKNTESLQNLSNPLLTQAETNDIQARQVGLSAIIPKENGAAPPSSTKLDGAHQDVNEQFYNAKMGDAKTGNSDNFQQSRHDQKGNEQQNKTEVQPVINQTSNSSVTDGKPTESSFGQQLNSTSLTTNTPAPIEGKLAPGAHSPVPEKEMMDNLIQRFNVNPRLQTSKLTMQLNPAELGSLKIDILVKGDSIKANIVAQSQQVLETLEKNLPKLRTILQEQGFTIDGFEVTLEGDGGNQKELFQEQFNSQQQEFTSSRSTVQNDDSFDSLLNQQDEAEENDKETTGVNLTV